MIGIPCPCHSTLSDRCRYLHGHHLVGDLRLADAMGAQAEGDVVEDVEMRKERQILEDEADGTFEGALFRNVGAVHADGTGIGRLEAGDHAKDGALAAAAGSEKGNELPAADLQGNAPDRFERAKGTGHVVQFENGVVGLCGCHRPAHLFVQNHGGNHHPLMGGTVKDCFFRMKINFESNLQINLCLT